MNTKRYLALVMALVMAFSLVVPVSAAPTSVDLLTHTGSDKHDTARLTVYVNDVVAAAGSIDSDMDAKLVLNYGNYGGNSTVTVAGQTETHANLTAFTLSGNSYSGINFAAESIATYFPGFNRLTESTEYAIKFVDNLGTASQNWEYSFKKTSNDAGVTLTVTHQNTVAEADTRWQALKGEAFTVTHDNAEDSFIKLATGSYLQLDTEKLTVNSDLKLDDFSNSDRVDANVTNAKAKLTYTNNSTSAYQLLLKEGTQFSLGKSIATVKQDLLVTMTNATKSYNDSILDNVYANLNTSTERELAESLLVVFSEIAGLVQSTNVNNPVVITFGTPNSTTTKDGNTTVITTTTENAAGTTDVTTVETTTVTTEETVGEVTTRTEEETVVTTSSTVTKESTSNQSQEEYTVKVTSQKVVTTTTYENDVQTDQSADVADSTDATVPVTIEVKEADSDVSALSQVTESVNIADAELNNLTSSAKAALVYEAVTKAQEDLQTEGTVQSVTVSLAIVARAQNDDVAAEESNKKTYEVKPEITTTVVYSGSATPVASSSTVSNDSLQGNFEITLPVPDALVNDGKLITVTHRSEDYDNETFQAPVLGSAGAYYVTFTVTHFSEFDLEPVTVAETGTADVAANLTLEDDIAINFHVYNLSLSDSYYSVHYSFNGETEKVVPLSSITPVDGEYSITVASCAAKQMADEVHFELYCGDTSIFSIDYSIRDYCLNKINDNSNASLVALCRAVLNYGASAQSYFNYNVNHPANEGISTSSPEDVPADYNNISVNVSSGINPRANMTLVSKTELNFRLDGLDTTHLGSVVVRDVTDSNAVTVIDEARLVKEEGTNYYAVKVKGIPAKYLNHVFELSYEYFGTQETIQYSPMTYAYRNQNKTTYGLGDLCRAMYGYWQAAAAYLLNN